MTYLRCVISNKVCLLGYCLVFISLVFLRLLPYGQLAWQIFACIGMLGILFLAGTVFGRTTYDGYVLGRRYFSQPNRSLKEERRLQLTYCRRSGFKVAKAEFKE